MFVTPKSHTICELLLLGQKTKQKTTTTDQLEQYLAITIVYDICDRRKILVSASSCVHAGGWTDFVSVYSFNLLKKLWTDSGPLFIPGF